MLPLTLNLMQNMNNTLLEIKNLEVVFYKDLNVLKAVRGVSFNVEKGETVGIVGESGSGKSVTCLSINRLLPKPISKITNGEILYKGKDILKMDIKEIHALRGKEIAMIFQEPMSTLNPLLKISVQMTEVLTAHQKITKKEALQKSIEMLHSLNIEEPEKRIFNYPHEFSGGMKQRVMIGTALLLNPLLLIADEPVTALDVTIQAEILNLIHDIKIKRPHMSLIFITHNLALLSRIADKIIVMYGGQIQEEADYKSFFNNPKHPYSIALLECLPNIKISKKRLVPIKGNVPDISDLPKGCSFWPRCEKVMTKCKELTPPLYAITDTHKVRCHLFEKFKTVEE